MEVFCCSKNIDNITTYNVLLCRGESAGQPTWPRRQPRVATAGAPPAHGGSADGAASHTAGAGGKGPGTPHSGTQTCGVSEVE